MPADGASIGEVYVDILPNDRNFWNRFVAQNRAQASKAGDDLGSPVGKGISDAISRGIRDGLRTGTRSESTRAGEEAGGAFAASFKRRVEAALKAIPDISIGANSTDAERKITELRARLDELRNRRIGIDIDAATAQAQLTSIHAELQRINATSANAQVRTDAGRAAAELAAFAAEVDRLDGRTIHVNVDDNGVRAVGTAARDASSSVSMLAAAGVALGPALIPVAATSAAAIAGILPAALGAAGGIGVLVLSLSGVVGAVKAMSAADDQATQSAASLAGNQARLAAGADAVRSAQASLANTVANAADSQRRASQAIANAELSEAEAHRTLLAAQQAVTQARIDAARAAEDLSSRVAHNALDQRQAALDTAKAEQQLTEARKAAGALPGNPAAQRALAEAQLAYDRQLQRNKDLQVETKRLTEDKAKSDKAGIDGSSQVVAALERVRTATEQVRRAEQATADARAAYAQQARQNAFAITQAQQSIVNAERSLQQATEATATAGGAAMLKLQQAMDDLSPAGQRFAAFIYGLRSPLLDLRRVGETGLLPGLQTGMGIMLTQMPRATDYTRRFSGELGTLAVRGAQAFTSPYWLNWADMLVDRAVPAMETGARITYRFTLGIAGLVRAFLPLSDNLGDGLLRFSERFATWANQLDRSQGYRDFLDYVRVQGPIVAHTIGEIVQAAVRLLEAIAPIGGVSLATIRLLAETINALPVPVLNALAAGIATVVVSTKAWGLANDVLKSSFASGVMDVFNSAVQNARLNMTLAEGQTGRFGLAMQGLKGAGQGATSAIGALAAGVGSGGALGIALAAGTVLIGLFAAAHQKAIEKEMAHKRNVQELTEELKRNNGAIDENVRKMAAKQAADDGAVTAARKAGVSVGEVVNAYIRGGGALSNLIAQQERYIESELRAAAQDKKNETQHLTNVKNSRDLIAILAERKGAADANEAATRAMAEADKAATGAAYEQTPVQKALGEALRKVADDTASAKDKADALRQADELLFASERNRIKATEDSALAQFRWNDIVAQAKKGTIDASTALDINSAKTYENAQQVLNNRRSLEDRFTALNNEYFAEIAAGTSVEEATRKHTTNKDALEKSAIAAGFDAKEVHNLAEKFGTLPTDPKVVVTVSGVKEAMTQLETLEIAQFALKNGLEPAEATRQYKKQRAQANSLLGAGGLATGGPVIGPGGPTEDLIPAIGPGGFRYRLSNGEHVITAAEVEAAGGHAAIIAWRKWLLGGRQPQALYPGDGSGGLAFARGGAVTWPLPVTAAVTRIPTMDEIRRVALFGPAYTGPVDGGLTAAVAFVRNQVGKPYIWASAGPYGYDCSGIVSAAYNVAHGRNPYVHTFSTHNEAAFFPLSGYGPFTAAWSNPGDRGPGGDSVGHTAARIGNYAFESVGGQGVRAGSSVTPLGSFAHIGHYDSGGPLPPGLTIAYNGTRDNEWVYTADQHNRAQTAMAGDGRLFRDLNVIGSDGMSIHELAKAVMAEMAWEMR